MLEGHGGCFGVCFVQSAKEKFAQSVALDTNSDKFDRHSEDVSHSSETVMIGGDHNFLYSSFAFVAKFSNEHVLAQFRREPNFTKQDFGLEHHHY